MCKHQHRFGLDVQCSALVLNFNNTLSNEHLYRAGQSMNPLPSQILERCASYKASMQKVLLTLAFFCRTLTNLFGQKKPTKIYGTVPIDSVSSMDATEATVNEWIHFLRRRVLPMKPFIDDVWPSTLFRVKSEIVGRLVGSTLPEFLKFDVE